MATIKPFSIFDLLLYNNINLDILTETFNTHFYGKYIAKWPELCIAQLNCTGKFQAYSKDLTQYIFFTQVLNKIEGDKQDNEKKNWHGHVTAITVSPDSRRQGFARYLMEYLEIQSNKQNGWFIDLFVRASNKVAIGMYESLGYKLYRIVNKYYSSSFGQNKAEDAYDMRKSIARDKDKVTSKPTGKVINPDDLEFQ